jgi:hypothetical protein
MGQFERMIYRTAGVEPEHLILERVSGNSFDFSGFWEVSGIRAEPEFAFVFATGNPTSGQAGWFSDPHVDVNA